MSWGWVPKCDDLMKMTPDNAKMLPKCDDLMKMTPENIKETAKCSQMATVIKRVLIRPGFTHYIVGKLLIN